MGADVDAKPYTLEELRGGGMLDLARVRATALALRHTQEALGHLRAFGHGAIPTDTALDAIPTDTALDAMQRQREAVAQVVAAYPMSESLGQQLRKVARAVPLVPLVRGAP